MKSGDNGEEDPPVPISITEVKLFSAEDTWRETAREDRSTPASFTTDLYIEVCCFFYLSGTVFYPEFRPCWGNLRKICTVPGKTGHCG